MNSCRKVLIVDDDALIRELFKAWFQRYSIDADTADNPEFGLELVTLNKYTIIIVDFSMPAMKGNELIKKIRMVDMRTKIIGTSAQHWVGDLFYKAGADYFVKKPVDFGELAGIIDKVL